MTHKSVYTDRYSTLLELLISTRRDAGLTQQDLAERLRRPQSYVSKYERGERRLDVIEFLDIVEILGADPCPLLKGLLPMRGKEGSGY